MLPSEYQSTGQRMALIISNSHYQDPRLLPLAAPETDAENLAEVLKNPQIGGFDLVRLFRDRPAHETVVAIEQFFRDRKKDDLLVLYFTGHGLLDRDGNRLYLAAPNTSIDTMRSTAIPAAFIADEMDSCRSRRKILILDCCYSGAFAGGKSAAQATVGSQSAFEGNGFGRMVLTASDDRQYAWENMAEAGRPQVSVFSHHLVEGLKTGAADRNGDGRVTVSELYEYVYDRVQDEERPQTPHLWTYGQQGELVVAHSPRQVQEQLGRELYDQAWKHISRRDWDAARKAWGDLQERVPGYPDPNHIAAILAGREQLDRRYTEMGEAVVQSRWEAALQKWAAIRSQDPAYVDHKDLLPQIRTGQELAARRRELDAQYNRMSQIARQNQWREALIIWQEIQRRDPTYPDRENLALAAERNEKQRRREQELYQRKAQLDQLYQQMERYCAQQQWAQAERIWDEIRHIDPNYSDVRGLAGKAAFEMERIRVQEALRERRRLLDQSYAEIGGLVQQRKWVEAQKQWDRIRQIDPDYPDRNKYLDVIQLQASTAELASVDMKPRSREPSKPDPKVDKPVPAQQKPGRRNQLTLVFVLIAACLAAGVCGCLGLTFLEYINSCLSFGIC